MGSGGWGGGVHNPDPLRAQVCVYRFEGEPIRTQQFSPTELV